MVHHNHPQEAEQTITTMKPQSQTENFCNNNPLYPQISGCACEWSDCDGMGAYRAPRSREKLNNYRWFCLAHIRLINKSWNYYEGMTEEAVEDDRGYDTVGRRPSWKLGTNGSSLNPEHIFDPMNILHDRGPPKSASGAPKPPPISKDEEQAYGILGIEYPTSESDLKKCYKKLVKLHHPDTNKGSKTSEEKIKKINRAYHLLRDASNNRINTN